MLASQLLGLHTLATMLGTNILLTLFKNSQTFFPGKKNPSNEIFPFGIPFLLVINFYLYIKQTSLYPSFSLGLGFCAAQADLELLFLLPEGWNHRHAPWYPIAPWLLNRQPYSLTTPGQLSALHSKTAFHSLFLRCFAVGVSLSPLFCSQLLFKLRWAVCKDLSHRLLCLNPHLRDFWVIWINLEGYIIFSHLYEI